jgi:ABC-type phosphate/phosphonate transport system substrate-binding protein
MPPVVATAPLAPETVERLRAAFRAAGDEQSLAPQRRTLLLERFVLASPEDYAVTRARAQAVEREGTQWP